MNKLLSRVKKDFPGRVSDTEFSYTEKVFDPESGGTISQWVLLLPGSGCAWAKEKGGCYMCGFKTKIKETNNGKSVSHQYLMKICQLGETMILGEPVEKLTIYNGGSFLNSQEIPGKTQIELCKLVKSHPTIRKLFVESRPEFVTHKKIRDLTSILGKKKLEVGMGLECATDEIRDRCVHKGFSAKDYERAVAVLKEYGAEVLTYVFLKPLYLTEREAIEEAIKTIDYAFKSGSNEVALESAFIQRGTRMERLYNQGKYELPWLWSIIQVVQNTYYLGPVTIGGFTDEPPPIAVPINCSKCSYKIMDLFAKYKETHDISLLNRVDCECKLEWLANKEKSLE